MNRYYLNTYRPLCKTKFGRQAILKYSLLPFIDGSCRREPDFESEFPSITAICRVDKFVPRLWPGDKIVYLTVQGNYMHELNPHYRLVSVLEVVERFENHGDAAKWYRNKNFKLPNNCLVDNNAPMSVEYTLGSIPEKIIRRFDKYPNNQKNVALGKYLSEWDNEYWERVKKCSIFIVCKKYYLELNEPKIIYPEEIRKIFNRIPGTQNPPQISKDDFKSLCYFVKI